VLQSLINERPMVHLAVKTPDRSYVNWDGVTIFLSGLRAHWNFPEGSKPEIEAITNADEVEVLLNGRSLGVKKREGTGKSASRRYWTVPYEPGTLVAVARKAGQEVARDELRSAGAPKRLRLTPDRPVLRADGQDLSHVTVEVVDSDGVVVPDDHRMIRFVVTGPGTNAGVQNSDVISDELFQSDQRSAFEGRALLVIRSRRQPGSVVVKAEAEGLESAQITIPSR
jgi:beta-galactosidase